MPQAIHLLSFAASNPFAAAGSFVKGFFAHQGGVIGVDALPQRPVPALAFAGATRYHNGGIAGLKPDERPAVLRRGEEILTEDNPRHRNNQGRGGQGVTINNSTSIIVNADNADRRTVTDLEALSGRIVERASQVTEARVMQSLTRGGKFAKAVGRF